MKEFILEIRFIIALIIGVIFFALFEKEQFKSIIYALMLQAKSMAKDMVLNSGQAQEDWVIDKAYIFLPKWMVVIIPKKVMRDIVRYLYRLARDKLDDGEVNGSIEG